MKKIKRSKIKASSLPSGDLPTVISFLSKQAAGKPTPDKEIEEGGVKVQVWVGSPGGGFAEPPSWVPQTVARKYQEVWEAADQADLVERGYDGEDEDGLQRSETDFEGAAGFTAIAPKVVGGILGIDHFVTKPIPFVLKGQKLVIWGGVSGV